MLARLKMLVTDHHMQAKDLLTTFVVRQVLPLQHRPHKIGHMSGRLDPSRLSTVELEMAEVARRIN